MKTILIIIVLLLEWGCASGSAETVKSVVNGTVRVSMHLPRGSRVYFPVPKNIKLAALGCENVYGASHRLKINNSDLEYGSALDLVALKLGDQVDLQAGGLIKSIQKYPEVFAPENIIYKEGGFKGEYILGDSRKKVWIVGVFSPPRAPDFTIVAAYRVVNGIRFRLDLCIHLTDLQSLGPEFWVKQLDSYLQKINIEPLPIPK